MKISVAFLFIFLIYGCNDTVTQTDLDHLNGYWEIEKVSFPDGNTKEYTISTTIDYIELNDMQGFRKKMQPKFDGTFTTSNDAERFVIVKKEDYFEITYKSDANERSEQIASLSPYTFSVINPEGLIYTYKRFESINISKE